MGQIGFWLIVLAPQDSVETIRAQDLQEHVATLASDAFEGRNAGTNGAAAAAQWIADRFQSFGLRAPFEGSYLQPFRFPVRSDTGSRSLFPPEGETANVVGILDGGDEVVVIGAHYDHVGKKGQPDPGRRNQKQNKGGDEIWNGADDNASGTATLLELAQALATLQPRRTLVFVAFGAEEHHLAGSTWYAQHPVLPLEKTVLMLNLDMVGRTQLEVHGAGTAEGLRVAVEKVLQEQTLPAEIFDFGDLRDPNSDYAPFVEAGVPALFFFTGFHEDYHESTDHADKLDYSAMEKIGRAAARLVVGVADSPERMKPRPVRSLGILVAGAFSHTALDKTQAGLWVAEVRKGSMAESAGIREGDMLIEIQGQKLPRGNTKRVFRKAFESIPPGGTVVVVVLRGTQKLELKLEIR